jgi:hypothetical protein
LVVAGNSSQNENTFLQKKLIGLLYNDPLANVCMWSQFLPNLSCLQNNPPENNVEPNLPENNMEPVPAKSELPLKQSTRK